MSLRGVVEWRMELLGSSVVSPGDFLFQRKVKRLFILRFPLSHLFFSLCRPLQAWRVWWSPRASRCSVRPTRSASSAFAPWPAAPPTTASPAWPRTPSRWEGPACSQNPNCDFHSKCLLTPRSPGPPGILESADKLHDDHFHNLLIILWINRWLGRWHKS